MVACHLLLNDSSDLSMAVDGPNIRSLPSLLHQKCHNDITSGTASKSQPVSVMHFGEVHM